MSAWVLVPCPRGRLEELRVLLAGLQHPVERTVVVTTLPEPINDADVAGIADHVVLYRQPGMVFSAWINAGLDYIDATSHGDATEVLCVGSDARGRADSVTKLRDGLRANDLAMAGPDWRGNGTVDPVLQLPRTVHNRVPGSCFMLATEYGLRMDERYCWWYSDDHLEMQARQVGRVGLIADTGLVHDTDHPLDAVQAQHATEDRERFVADWGCEPW